MPELTRAQRQSQKRQRERRENHVGAPCLICSTPIPFRARRYCSTECAYVARRAWFAEYNQRPEQKAMVNKWRAENPSYFRDRERLRRDQVRPIKAAKERRRRARKARAGLFLVTPRDLMRARSRSDNRCSYCGSRFSESLRITWDHVIPLSRGGRDSIGNLVPACGACNFSKHSKFVMEWRVARVEPVRARAVR